MNVIVMATEVDQLQTTIPNPDKIMTMRCIDVVCFIFTA